MPAPRNRTVTARPREGGLCGDARLRGQRIPPVTSANPQCGIARPVRVFSVAGVRLTRPATVNCRLARRLADWVEGAVIPATARLGAGLDRIDVIASYSCRTRNGRRGARISEHARGNAIDIAGFLLSDGRKITVLAGWRRSPYSAFLKSLHRRACTVFGTVLGPDSDRHHRNHFHLDAASYRSGSYCR